MSGEERRKIVNPAERYTEISFFIRIILDKLQNVPWFSLLWKQRDTQFAKRG